MLSAFLQVELQTVEPSDAIDRDDAQLLSSQGKEPWRIVLAKLRELFRAAIWTWLPSYDFQNWFAGDAVSGITLGIMLFPQVRTLHTLQQVPASLSPSMLVLLEATQVILHSAASIWPLLHRFLSATASSLPHLA